MGKVRVDGVEGGGVELLPLLPAGVAWLVGERVRAAGLRLPERLPLLRVAAASGLTAAAAAGAAAAGVLDSTAAGRALGGAAGAGTTGDSAPGGATADGGLAGAAPVPAARAVTGVAAVVLRERGRVERVAMAGFGERAAARGVIRGRERRVEPLRGGRGMRVSHPAPRNR